MEEMGNNTEYRTVDIIQIQLEQVQQFRIHSGVKIVKKSSIFVGQWQELA
jgi:hypothetical protein